MTTIVWRDGVLAADRQATMGNCSTRSTKLFRVHHYALGVSGNLAYGIAFRDWFASDQKQDCPLDDHTYALVMDLDTGECHQWEAPGQGIPVEDGFASIGSGSDFAYGAMEMGADAKKAVLVASKWDVNTGKGVQTIRARRSNG